MSQFRAVAKKSYQPWYQRREHKAVLRRLKRCAPNEKTVRLMQKTEKRFAHKRGSRIKLHLRITSCSRWGSRSTCTSSGGTHYAMPTYIVYCESGGNFRSDARKTGLDGGGAYGLRQHWANVYATYHRFTAPWSGVPVYRWPPDVQGMVALSMWDDNGAAGWACP